MKIFIITVLCCIFTFNQQSKAQWSIMKSDADSLVILGSDYIYNCKFDSAAIMFQKVIQMYPTHPAGYFLDAMVEWWQLTLFRDYPIYDKSFEKKINKVIDICDNLLDENQKDINALFFKAGALGYRGRYFVNKEDWIDAAKDGSTAFDLLMECHKIAPGNHDIMLGTGIYNYFAEVIPQKYPLVKPFTVFLPRGDKKIGLLQLQASAKLARYTSIEAKVVLMQLYYTFENDAFNSLLIAQELFNKYPNNAYFQRFLARSKVKIGDSYDAELQWRDILIKCMAKKIGYDKLTAREAMFYIGVYLMNKGDFENSLKYFYKCDEGSRVLDKEVSGFMVKANLYIGKIFDLQNKRYYAKEQYKKILKMKDYDGSHDEAEKYLDTPFKR